MEDHNKKIKHLLCIINFVRNYEGICEIIPPIEELDIKSIEERKKLEIITMEELKKMNYFI